MSRVDLSEVKQLSAITGTHLVSLYLPTHEAGEERVQDGIRLTDLLQQGEDRLVLGGIRRPVAKELLALGRAQVQDSAFWSERSQGLAMFLSPGQVRTYRVAHAFPESLTIHSRFHIKPLLPCVDRGEWFYLLVLSQNCTRLYRVTQSAIAQLPLPGVPSSLSETLNYTFTDRGEQVHSGTRGNLGKQAAVFHGQGGMPDEAKSDLTEYFQAVDRALQGALPDVHAPLLLAGVDYAVNLFRQSCSHQRVSDDYLRGNFDRVSDVQLHEQSWPLMRAHFDQPRHEALRRVAAQVGTGKSAAEITEVVRAAASGKVETLLVDPRRDAWGRFDRNSDRVQLDDPPVAGSEDLINLAVAEAFNHAASVYPAEAQSLPDGSPVAAIYRY